MRKVFLVLCISFFLTGCIEWKAKGDTEGYIKTPPTPEIVQPEKKEV